MKRTNTKIIYVDTFSKGEDTCTTGFYVIGKYSRYSNKVYNDIKKFVYDTFPFNDQIKEEYMENIIDDNIIMGLFNTNDCYYSHTRVYKSKKTQDYLFRIQIHSTPINHIETIAVSNFYQAGNITNENNIGSDTHTSNYESNVEITENGDIEYTS